MKITLEHAVSASIVVVLLTKKQMPAAITIWQCIPRKAATIFFAHPTILDTRAACALTKGL